MNDYCVVVAAGSRARFFTLSPAEIPEMQSGPNLVERSDLISPERATHEKDMWSDTKSGRNRSSGGGAHGYDDHRAQHEDEFERRFAREVVEQAEKLVSSNGNRRIIMVAQKRMLGFLRNSLEGLRKNGVEIHEVAKDLSKMKPMQLHEALSMQNLLPARQSPSL